jgi:hypothetical protein
VKCGVDQPSRGPLGVNRGVATEADHADARIRDLGRPTAFLGGRAPRFSLDLPGFGAIIGNVRD